MRLSFYIFLLLNACTLNAQSLVGKLVYSYHNRSKSTNADSIFSFDNGKKTFVTLGFDPRVSTSGNYMAFANGPNSNSAWQANLWIRNLSTQRDTEIIQQNDYLNYYDFAPADAHIVYAQQCAIYSSNINGSNAFTYLTCAPCDCFSDDPQIRQSDGLILYHNLHYGLYTANPDGSNAQQIPNTVPGDMYPVWSSNGKWIAFIKGSFNNIYKIKPGGSDSVKLTFFSSADTIAPNPAWSRDSKNIYFFGRIKNKIGIYKVAANGSGTYTTIHTFNSPAGIYDYFLSSGNLIPASFSDLNNIADDNSLNAFNNADKIENNSDVIIYPNPVKNILQIKGLDPLVTASVSIVNFSGKTITKMVIENSNTYNISSLPAGSYYINIIQNAEVINLKFIKE